MPPALSSRTDWYKPGDDDPTLDPAREAFKLAAEKFGAVLTKDARKRDRVNQTSSILELQSLVTDAQSKYAAKHESHNMRKWLVKLSNRIAHYGTILDVLVQHHPEYVSLAWGAMKFLFVAVQNHEALLSCVAKALAQIADLLPGVEVAAVLFPTEQMKLVLAEIYALTMRFFIRAHDWFSENKLLRALHSITRPKELRYDDLVQDITAATTRFRNMAVTASQAEQRDMHILLLEMKQMMTSYQQLNASAMLNTNMALTDLQFSSILNALSNIPLEDPDKSLQQAIFLRNRATARTRKLACEPFWLHPRFRAWTNSPSSSLIMVQGTFAGRATMKDCLVNAIETIRQADATALWALKTMDSSVVGPPASITAVELIKYLTAQALRFGPPPTERSLSLSCAQFQSARGEKEWIGLLAGSLAGLKRVFIVVDVELLMASAPPQPRFTLPESLGELFAQLGARSLGTVVKIMLVSYGSPVFRGVSEEGKKDLLFAGKGRPQRPAGASRGGNGIGVSGIGPGRGQLRRGLGLQRAMKA